MTRQDVLDALVNAGYTRNKVNVKEWEVVVAENLRCKYGWPLLWSIIEKLGLSWGGGGTYYVQIDAHKLKDE